MRWTVAGALAGLIAHGAFGLTDAVALGAKPGVFFWMLLGLITATWLLTVQRGYGYNVSVTGAAGRKRIPAAGSRSGERDFFNVSAMTHAIHSIGLHG